MNRPVLTIVAGSNGCGKSTLTSGSRTRLQATPVLDPDMMARSLQDTLAGTNSNVEAGKKVLRQADEYLEAKQSFVVETTLSGNTYLKMAAKAKEAGFSVFAVLVGTASLEINLARVRARVEMGGHDVPEDDQRRRYPRTLANMKRLLPMSDLAMIFDNSTDKGHVLIGFGRTGLMNWVGQIPNWAIDLKSLGGDSNA